MRGGGPRCPATEGLSRRALLVSCGLGLAVSVLGNVPLMGLPGALALAPALPIIEAIWGSAEFPQDSAWPWAILTTLCLGPLVPLAWMGTARLAGWRRGLVVGLGLVTGSVAVALATYAATVAPMLPASRAGAVPRGMAMQPSASPELHGGDARGIRPPRSDASHS